MMHDTWRRAQDTSLVLITLLSAAAPATAQVYRVAALNTEQIQTLDRARTVVVIPAGILEEHGPYLPSYTDGYGNERVAQSVAEAVAARPGWTALVFPSIPLGTGGANEIGRKYVFPGTYTVRSTTLRSVFMDLGDELGGQGFRWIFVVHGHGAPNHNRMLDQAGDYFHDTYGGWMVHLAGLLPVSFASVSATAADALREDGLGVHAGAVETSMMLFLLPGLVSPSLKEAGVHSGADWAALVRVARAASWPGYLGSPRLATAALGARVIQELADTTVTYALKILDGMDPRDIPRLGDVARDSPENVAIDDDALQHERQKLRKQEEWLTQKKLR